MLSTIFLIKQGKCCGRGCLMCPYTNKHSGKSKVIRGEVWNDLKDWEKEQLNMGALAPSDDSD
jgi:hypothetical protein